jgi:SAM-dependent methyltransferase
METNLHHIEKCPLCGGLKFVHHETCEDYFVSHERFLLMRCCNCGFVFTQDVPIGKDMKRYYEAADYISHSDTKKGVFNHIYHHVRNIMLKRKRRLAVKGKKVGNLLDVGCGTGYFAAAVKRKGWNVVGVEPSETAAAK